MNGPNVKIIVLLGLAAASAASLSGCVRHHIHHAHDSRPLIVPARLDCPQTQGSLTRVSAAADGSSCEYRRDDGEQVSLVRLALTGASPQAGLAPIEASLKALLPPRKEAAAKEDHSESDGKDSARIDVPGVHIDAHGDKAEVRVFGVTIDADNNKANVNAGIGGDKAVISADETGAEIRATDEHGANANMVLMLASDHPGPTGLYSVGYIARGPSTGPLVVAEFKNPRRRVRSEDDHDIHRLIEQNLSR